MSTSDTMSESNSPYSQMESPYSSPSQQVPQLANNISELSCADDAFIHKGRRPELRIVEQPHNYFRFRYRSEMLGTHGSLQGKSSTTNKPKTHPAVELKNFSGKALIRCTLARHDSSEEHPHKLLEDDLDRDVSSILPHHGSYRVAFSGMGIIQTAKKDIASILYKKYVTAPNSPYNENKLRAQCEKEAKSINLNIVRLKFTAHDLVTEKEICPPVFSEPIHNMKSAATNDLKICRISRCYGRPKGGDDVFIFVEKVNKKNIKIRFFELDENGVRVWESMGTFLQSDVHHQYGIVFRTPQYRNGQITSDVKVFVELVRPSDGRTSEPREFIYKADYSQSKKRKNNSSYSSLDSISGSSDRSFYEIPATIDFINRNGNFKNTQDEIMKEPPPYSVKLPTGSTAGDLFADAIWSSQVSAGAGGVALGGAGAGGFAPLLSAPSVPAPPVLALHSSEMDRILEHPVDITPEEKRQFLGADLSEYFAQFDGNDRPSEMNFLKDAMMVADSAKVTKLNNFDTITIKEEKGIKKKPTGEYSAVYKSEDGVLVKKLVSELCEMLRNKKGYRKQLVRDKLERLFEMRLSNGDTFLHMTLCSNQPSLEYIVKLIHSVKMFKLLNLKNDEMQTVLHLAIVYNLPRLVSFLVSKGCHPMEEDSEGNNAIHYAVVYESCIGPLLDAIKNYHVHNCDINAFNNEKQTALHVAAVYGSAESAEKLLAHGASLAARDAAGRTPLHLAAYDDCRAVAAALLGATAASTIDMLDGNGYTALQIVCEGEMRANTLEIAKLLLEKKADPKKHEEFNQPAWKLARDKPELLKLLQQYMDPLEDVKSEPEDIKSEPEEDYESADDDEATEGGAGLAELAGYVDELSAALERSGAWRELARRRCGALLGRLAAAPRPAHALLLHLRDFDDITSKSLALILEDMGQPEAASIVKRYI
ncbi:nuclear factor NF-kappa-B p110 subunit [Melitaea cinxia]|uniref:nuclear factor NF-kappa-B p110 subunit n=1 Tax=Melitaea cinxia TaxID=113334 RepID=UPI001E27402F|nr:nuclear factor NF-kappa-B p110 subunit [Melitaea cinxia]